MKEVTYKIPDDLSELITELVEKLGGFVEKKAMQKIQLKKNSKKNSEEKKTISPTFLFGKWKDLDLDPVTYRDKLWPRKEL